MAHDVFISYENHDKAQADAVCARLEAHGIRCWIAPRDIAPGVEWDDAIVEALAGSRALVLVFSDHANNSKFVKKEVSLAVDNRLIVIPLRCENVEPTGGLGLYLKMVHWLDALTAPFEQHLEGLATLVSGILLAQGHDPNPQRAPAEVRPPERTADVPRHAATSNLPGGVIVKTDPAGAEVQVGIMEEVLTPATIKGLAPRAYPLTISLEGYETVEANIAILPDKFTYYPERSKQPLKLVRSTGSLYIGSKLAQVAWELVKTPDGPQPEVKKGQTPESIENMPTGDYTVEFRREGWPSLRQDVRVERGATAQAEAEFAGGDIEIESEPSGAEVTDAKGNKLGVTPLAFKDLLPGKYEFSFRLNGYKTAKWSGELEAKKKLKLNARLEETHGALEGENWTVPEYGIEMIWINPGTFTMGSPESESGHQSDETQHQVTLTKGYWLGKFEVTQGQWQAVMGNNPSNFQNAGSNAPVEQVSWDDAQKFCKQLTAQERSEGRLPAGYEYSLPTEAQWEYACRAGTTNALNNGKELTSKSGECRNLNEVAWYDKNSGGTTHPVGQKKPNAWGLYDMHGNVYEWCYDWYDSTYPSGAVTDPTGPNAATRRVKRGGSWFYNASFCRSAFRNLLAPGCRVDDLGFRLALRSVH